jgi:hypothetical protein
LNKARDTYNTELQKGKEMGLEEVMKELCQEWGDGDRAADSRKRAK